MKASTLATLAAECSGKPPGVAARIDAVDLMRLLEEREVLRSSLKELVDDIEDNVDIGWRGEPNYAMRLMDGIAGKAATVMADVGSESTDETAAAKRSFDAAVGRGERQ